MTTINVTVQNLDSSINKLKQYGEKAVKALGSALYQEAEVIMTESKDKYCPVDTGRLRASGYVERPEVSRTEISVNLGYGGSAKSYALIVHEDTRPKNWQKAGTGPKYLEIPVKNATSGMADRLAVRAARSIP